MVQLSLTFQHLKLFLVVFDFSEPGINLIQFRLDGADSSKQFGEYVNNAHFILQF